MPLNNTETTSLTELAHARHHHKVVVHPIVDLARYDLDLGVHLAHLRYRWALEMVWLCLNMQYGIRI